MFHLQKLSKDIKDGKVKFGRAEIEINLIYQID